MKLFKVAFIGWMLAAGVMLLLWLASGQPASAVSPPPPDQSTVRPAGTAFSYTTTTVINTYPYAAYLYDRYNATYNVTYKWLDWNAYRGSNPHPSARSYQLLVVENDYLRLTFLPELGGRIYQLVFKPTGHNQLYQNKVIKPTGWGPPEQGWWLAVGGIEWGLPVEEHGYQSGAPWSYTTLAAADGLTVTLRDSTASDRLRAAISVYLPADRAYFIVRPRLENARSVPLAYKYWSNAMIAPGAANTVSADLRFVYPVSQVTVHSTGDGGLPGEGQAMSWPAYNGRDMSRLGNWYEWLGFFERPAAQGSFTAIYDPSCDEGLVRVFPADRARGVKGFAFGWHNALPAFLWTDDGSAYAEMHGGVVPTFWDSAFLAAGASYEWQETWYPAAGIGGVTAANREAALYLDKSGDALTVGVYPTAAQANGAVAVWRPGDAAPLHYAILPGLGPAQPYKTTLTASGDAADWVLIYLDAADRPLAASRTVADHRPPRSQLAPLPPYTTATAVALAWGGEDDSAVLNYDVQARDGYAGAWTDWLTRTTQTSATYTGLDGHTYFFRLRARDVWGNVEGWRDAEWGDGFTSLLVTPAPVLITSRKQPGRDFYLPGEVVTYTLSLRNTGSLAAAARLTDTLPAAMTLLSDTLAASQGTPLAGEGLVTWQGNVAAGQWVTVTYALSPTGSVALLAPIVNGVTIAGSLDAPFSRQAVVRYARLVWLPCVARRY